MAEKEISPKMKNILIVAATVNAGAIIILVVIKIWMMVNEDTTKVVIEKFHNNKELICVSNKRNLSKGDKYLVSLKRGWNIYNADYVIKDDLIIELKNCN